MFAQEKQPLHIYMSIKSVCDYHCLCPNAFFSLKYGKKNPQFHMLDTIPWCSNDFFSLLEQFKIVKLSAFIAKKHKETTLDRASSIT